MGRAAIGEQSQEARLAGAESREIRALAAYEISLINIAVATGTLLG